ncbi:MAG: tRNA 5-methoxyuridine(34)/uridine 5-oxyacetic acid(34) synthase CmoB [Campylobacterota bacterium]|nr:tRNA 5-methoxyuridine(34)/uridine 5-oxyacetic acid(34) synthase CmoB [Campylobacterota bacterium]
MNLEEYRKEKAKCVTWKNIQPIYRAVQEAKTVQIDNLDVKFDDWVSIGVREDIRDDDYAKVYHACEKLIPWRKGPFSLFDIKLDTEWQSNIKYNLIRPHFDLKDKIVADIGCNNGYYMYRMLEDKPKRLTGFDPSPLTMLQFDFINHFAKTPIIYEQMGVEHLDFYEHKFDFIFMLGVLYHRPDPIGTLKSLRNALNKDGEILIDTFMIDGEQEVCLTPKGRYSKIPNIFFIPTIPALKNWVERAGFINIEILETTITTSDEQRKTSWSFDQSLEDFLDPNDSSKTVEGYSAPKRMYLKAKKKN